MAAMLDTLELSEAMPSDQRPPNKASDLPQSYARDLKVPRNHTGAMRSERANLWKYSSSWELYRLLGVDTFESV